MSMATLERAILANARTLLNNPKLKRDDILEWSTGDIGTHDIETEIVVRVPNPGVNVCVKKSNDKRFA